MKKSVLLIMTILILIQGLRVSAQEPEFLSVSKIKDNVYNLHLNVGVVVGEEFVVLIESGYGEYEDSNKKILEAVSSITDKPIKYVINMHSHGDHSGGNKFFAKRGATIITHKNVVYSSEYESHFPKSNAVRFDKRFELHLGNEVIEIEHMVSHTFDDGMVYLRNSDVLFIGENYKPNHLTYLGMYGLDSFDTWGELALSKMSNNTIVVPAHGFTLLNKNTLLTYRANYLAWLDRINTLHQQGKTPEQMTKDQIAKSFVNKLNLDNNPKHHGEYYQSAIEGLIRFAIEPGLPMNQTKMTEYVGTYKLNGKEDINISIMDGRLVAKQKNSFISWIKPIAQDNFESMTFWGERLHFTRDQLGKVSSLRTSFPEKTHYQQRLTGEWFKVH